MCARLRKIEEFSYQNVYFVGLLLTLLNIVIYFSFLEASKYLTHHIKDLTFPSSSITTGNSASFSITRPSSKYNFDRRFSFHFKPEIKAYKINSTMDAHLGCDFLDKPVSTGVSIRRFHPEIVKFPTRRLFEQFLHRNGSRAVNKNLLSSFADHNHGR